MKANKVKVAPANLRLVKAVESFLKLRPSIFPTLRGSDACAAYHELQEALREAGGKVPFDFKDAK